MIETHSFNRRGLAQTLKILGEEMSPCNTPITVSKNSVTPELVIIQERRFFKLVITKAIKRGPKL